MSPKVFTLTALVASLLTGCGGGSDDNSEGDGYEFTGTFSDSTLLGDTESTNIYFATEDGYVAIILDIPDGADYDLSVIEAETGASAYAAEDTWDVLSGATEWVVIPTIEGNSYEIIVSQYSGTGDYGIQVTEPNQKKLGLAENESLLLMSYDYREECSLDQVDRDPIYGSSLSENLVVIPDLAEVYPVGQPNDLYDMVVYSNDVIGLEKEVSFTGYSYTATTSYDYRLRDNVGGIGTDISLSGSILYYKLADGVETECDYALAGFADILFYDY